MAKKYLFDWKVETLLPLQDKSLKKLAIMSWVQKLDEVAWKIEQERNPNRRRKKKGTMPTKFHVEHLYVPEMEKYVGSYLGWRYQGYPAPRLIRDDGLPGIPFDLEIKFPGSLRTLLHPGWVMLSGPATLESCRFLLQSLEPTIAKTLAGRFHIEAPDVASRKRSIAMTMMMGQSFYTTCYVAWLKKLGSFEAFIGALGLSIEYFLHKADVAKPELVFRFDPQEWSFCNSMEADNLSFLTKRVDDLNEAYLDKAAHKNYSFFGFFLKPHAKFALTDHQQNEIVTILNSAL